MQVTKNSLNGIYILSTIFMHWTNMHKELYMPTFYVENFGLSMCELEGVTNLVGTCSTCLKTFAPYWAREIWSPPRTIVDHPGSPPNLQYVTYIQYLSIHTSPSCMYVHSIYGFGYTLDAAGNPTLACPQHQHPKGCGWSALPPILT